MDYFLVEDGLLKLTNCWNESKQMYVTKCTVNMAYVTFMELVQSQEELCEHPEIHIGISGRPYPIRIPVGHREFTADQDYEILYKILNKYK